LTFAIARLTNSVPFESQGGPTQLTHTQALHIGTDTSYSFSSP